MGTDDELTGRPTIEDRGGTTPFEPRIGADRYRVGERIGRGGMGEVLAAQDLHLGREVAIKRMRDDDPGSMQMTRFLHEARIQGRLDHPAIVPVYDLGFDLHGQPYFAMKKLAGTTLTAILQSGQVSRQRLLRAFADVCLAVEFAHVRGVIHRDIKPDNIMLGDFGEVYVLDWGVARVAGEHAGFGDLHGDGDETLAGTVIGTPAYMSPEQSVDSASVDERTDVYSLGRVLADIVPPDGDPPPELVALVAHASAYNRDMRLGSARDLGDEVQRYLDGDRDLGLRRRLAADHLEQARAAFGAGLEDEDRGTAIRAASSAMALDPTLVGAAELVGRLMLEPPRVMPPEVRRAMLTDDARRLRVQGRAALWANLIALVVMVPLLLVMSSPETAALLGALFALNSLLLWHRVRDESFTPSVWLLAFTNATLIAVLSRVFSPMIVAPGVAAIVGLLLASNPFLESIRAVALLGVTLELAVVLPVVAEQLGLLPSTMELLPTGLLIHPLPPMPTWMMVPMVASYAAGMVGAALTIGRFSRTHERSSRRQLHLQAWQLRQLVADPLAAP